MSVIANAMKRAITFVANGNGSVAFDYWDGSGWVAIEGVVAHIRDTSPGHDDDRGQKILTHSGTVTTPLDAVSLSYGQRVRIGSTHEFKVVQILTKVNQQRYFVERRELRSSGPDRGELT